MLNTSEIEQALSSYKTGASYSYIEAAKALFGDGYATGTFDTNSIIGDINKGVKGEDVLDAMVESAIAMLALGLGIAIPDATTDQFNDRFTWHKFVSGVPSLNHFNYAYDNANYIVYVDKSVSKTNSGLPTQWAAKDAYGIVFATRRNKGVETVDQYQIAFVFSGTLEIYVRDRSASAENWRDWEQVTNSRINSTADRILQQEVVVKKLTATIDPNGATGKKFYHLTISGEKNRDNVNWAKAYTKISETTFTGTSVTAINYKREMPLWYTSGDLYEIDLTEVDASTVGTGSDKDYAYIIDGVELDGFYYSNIIANHGNVSLALYYDALYYKFSAAVGTGGSTVSGTNTLAIGSASRAEGNGNVAAGNNQTVVGKYNKFDNSALFVVGDGDDDETRSNSVAVGAEGRLSGALYDILINYKNEFVCDKVKNVLNELGDCVKFIKVVHVPGGNWSEVPIINGFERIAGLYTSFEIYVSHIIRNGYLYYGDADPVTNVRAGLNLAGYDSNHIQPPSLLNQKSNSINLSVAIANPKDVTMVIICRMGEAENKIQTAETRLNQYRDTLTDETPFLIVQGGLSGDGSDNNQAVYKSTRRRSQNYVYLWEGSRITCPDGYTFKLHRYASGADQTDVGKYYNFDVCGNDYTIVDAGWYRISLMKGEGAEMAEDEYPSVTVTPVQNKPIDAYEMVSDQSAVLKTYSGVGLFIQGAIARAGTNLLPDGSGTAPNYAARSAYMEHFVPENVISIDADAGYYLTFRAYNIDGTYAGFPTRHDYITTTQSNPIYYYQHIDMVKLRDAYPDYNFRVIITTEENVQYNAEFDITQPVDVRVLEQHVKFTAGGDRHIRGYYETEMLATVESVRAELTEPALVFPVVTDIHYQSIDIPTYDYCIDNIREFTRHIACDFVANLGDNTDGNVMLAMTESRNRYMSSRFAELPVPVKQQIGNHDTNYQYRSGAQIFTQKQIFSQYLSNVSRVIYNDWNDYYVDYDELNIRVVYLDANHTEVGLRARVYLYSSFTVGWLRNTALKENGAWTNRTVIVLEHESPAATTNADAESIMFGSYQDPTSAYGVTDWVETVFDDFVSANGKLINICGHSHADYYCAKTAGAYAIMADVIYGYLNTETQKLYKEDTLTTPIELVNNDLVFDIVEKKYYVYNTGADTLFTEFACNVYYGYLDTDGFYHDEAHTKPISYLADADTCYDFTSQSFYAYRESETPHFVLDSELTSKKWLSIHLNCQKMMQADLSRDIYQKITAAIDINAPERTPGTATEDCWSVIVVKPRSHEVDVIRFGAGNDRKYDYVECTPIT